MRNDPDYEELGRLVRAEILRVARPDSCIMTVAATLDALRQWPVEAYALAVSAAVFNRPLIDAIERLGRIPAVGDPDYPPDGWALGIGVEENGYHPHVVAIARRAWLLDYSLDQASRPAKGMVLDGPLVAPVSEAFLRGRENMTTEVGDMLVTYAAFPADKWFRASNNWSGGEYAPKVTLRKRRHVPA